MAVKKITKPQANREHWLTRMVDIFRPAFKAAGHPIPDNVRISTGWPGITSKKHVLGSCWAAECSADGAREIFISPTAVDDPMRIAGIVCHELVHAVLPHKVGHKAEFKTLGEHMLLEGKPTCMTGGELFHSAYHEAVEALGPFPGALLTKLSTAGGGGGNKKRKSKVTCTGCSATFRVAEKWLKGKDLRCINRNCDGELDIEGNSPPEDED